MKPKTDELWERFAQEDPTYYIYTDVGGGDAAQRASRFFESGRRDAQHILSIAQNHLSGTGVVMEIGCGAGRVLLPMSRHFDAAYGVDISPTMLGHLKLNARRHEYENVHGRLASEPWVEDKSVDFVYSWIVFQHIENFSVIKDYIRRISLALKSGGVATLQFDTRPPGLLYRLRAIVPDAFLPRPWRRGIRRIRRAREDLAEAFSECSLEIVAEIDPLTKMHTFVLCR